MIAEQPLTLNLAKIDQVIADLDDIILWSVNNGNRNGYFAALYKNITIRVKAEIEKGLFDDGARMVDFIHVFANSYIQPQISYRIGKLEPSHPWYGVFSTGRKKCTIMQHLLLGVNTHINYDLANTSVTICPGNTLLELCNDYVHINTILYSAIHQVEKEIYTLSPLLSLLMRFFPKFNKKILSFSLNVARSQSWECACRQSLANEIGKAKVRQEAATMTAELRDKILHPGVLANGLLFMIRLLEWRSIRGNVQVLDQKAWI